MRPSRSRFTACLLALAVVGLTVAVPRGLARAQRGVPEESPCLPQVRHSISPFVLLAGEEVTATLPISIWCAAEMLPTTVVVVLDGSASMSGDALDRAVTAAEALVDWLDPENLVFIQVGVVGFWDSGSYRCSPTSDPGRVRQCIRRIRNPGVGPVVQDLGLKLAHNVMSMAYADRATRLAVVFSNGSAPTDCDAAERSGDRLRGLGARLLAACAGPACDTACMRQVAGRDRDFVPANQLPRAWLSRLENEDVAQIIQVRPSHLTVTGTLPAGSDLLPGRVVPPPRSVSPDGRTLEWRFDQADFTSFGIPRRVTVTLGLRLTRPGFQAAGLHAFGSLVDSEHRDRHFAIDDAWAVVLGPP